MDGQSDACSSLLREVTACARRGDKEAAAAVLGELRVAVGGGGASAAARLTALVRMELVAGSGAEWLSRLSVRYPEVEDVATEFLEALSAAEPEAVAGDWTPVSIVIPDSGRVELFQVFHAGNGDADWSMSSGNEMWPGARVLAGMCLSGRVAVRGTRVLEIGCGLGLVGLACLRARAEAVLLTDYDENLLRAAWRSACSHGYHSSLTTLSLDWNDPPSRDALLGEFAMPGQGPSSPSGGLPFDLLLGADIVYEERHASLVLSMLTQWLWGGVVNEAVIVTGGQDTRDGVRAFCDALGLDWARFCDAHADSGVYVGETLEHLQWTAEAVPGIKHGRLNVLFRFKSATREDARGKGTNG